MKNITSIQALKQHIQPWRLSGLQIGFVPTMGNLHAGHIELINQAKIHCDKVVVSIFVNPLQFNDVFDFESYPETLDADQQKLIDANVDLLFLPTSKMIYPNGQQNITKVCVPVITEILEGESRPGHFDGVSTVVNKLFNLVQPHAVFFGEKDYQQLLLVNKMVEDLNLSIEVKSVQTYREVDGLAMSSRNSRLSTTQRKLAPKLYQILKDVSQQVLKSEQSLVSIEKRAIKNLECQGFDVDYVCIKDSKNLQTANDQSVSRRVLAAVKLGDVRLIDNLLIDSIILI